MSRYGLASAAVVLTLLTALRAASAASEDPEELIREGVKLRRQGENARAEGYFRRAYEIAATPRTAAQLGLVELAVGEFLDAETHLSQSLVVRDTWVTEHKQAIEDSRVAARKHLVRVELSLVPPDTTFSYTGVRPTAVPADLAIFIAPGKPTSLRFEAPAHKAAVVQVEGVAGETRHVTVDMPAIVQPPPVVAEPSAPPPEATAPPVAPEPTTTPASTPEPTRGKGLRIAGIVVGSVGAAVAIAGGVIVGNAVSKRNALQSDVTGGKLTFDAFNSRNQSWMNERTLGIVCLATGGVALVGGAALLAVGIHERGEEAAAVSFVPGPGFGLLSYRRSF